MYQRLEEPAACICILRMKAGGPSEMSVTFYQMSQHHTPDNHPRTNISDFTVFIVIKPKFYVRFRSCPLFMYPLTTKFNMNYI